MKNYLRSTVAIAGFGLLTAVTLAPAIAQTTRPSAPRVFPSQQVAYIRASLTSATCSPAPAGAGSCTVKLAAALPYNAVVLRVTAVTHTAFNSTTTDTVTLGTTSANANEIVSAGCSIHAQAIVACTVLATASSATGSGATQTGGDGGFELYVKYSNTGGANATAGNAALVIEYVMPNDGLCTAVAMGATAAGC